MHITGPLTGFLKKEINQMILPRWIDQVIAKVFEILHGAQVKKRFEVDELLFVTDG